MFLIKKIRFIVLSVIISIMLMGCSDSLIKEGVQDEGKEITEIIEQEGTIRLSKLLENEDLILYFIWDENIFNIDEFDEYAKVDISSKTLVFDNGGVYVLGSTFEFNDFEDMRLSELLEVSEESIDNAVKNGNEPCVGYKLVGYTNEEGELYQEVLLTVEELGEGNYSGFPFYFEKSFSKEINGENYIGFYMVDENGIQVCMGKYEDVTIIFDNESDLIMNQELQDVFE